jgi:hypothetical protein
MAALLQAQADAQPTTTISDIDSLQQLGVIQVPSTTTNPYSVQPALKGATSSDAVLQRLTEIETMIKNGFDKIASKLANTMIMAKSQGGGKRRRSTKKRRRHTK